MNISNFLRNLFLVDFVTRDPGSGGTIRNVSWGEDVELVSAGAEARTLAAPTKAGQFITISAKTLVGNVTLTVTGGYNVAGATTLVFSANGQWAMFESVNNNGTYVWRLCGVDAAADTVTSGGVIIPNGVPLVELNVGLHASKVIYNAFVARDAWQVTHIDYTPDIAAGSALTATAVKATGTATPASATTPLHIAGAINLNASAHTVQPITLSVTTADLQLAAGDRIGLVLSGAMGTGSGLLSIRGKRI